MGDKCESRLPSTAFFFVLSPFYPIVIMVFVLIKVLWKEVERGGKEAILSIKSLFWKR